MKLVSDIINDLVDLDQPLTSSLLKTKVLATRIKNEKLLQWIDGELNGYSEDDDLPRYRETTGEIVGSFMNGRWHVQNQLIPISHLPKKQIELLRYIANRDSVSSLEKLTTERRQADVKLSVPEGVKSYLEQTIRELGNPYYALLSIYKQFSATFLPNILSSVRSKLLEFMLAIESEFGEESEIESLKSQNNKVTNIVNTTIHNHGDANIVNTGNKASINAHVSIIKGDKEELRKALLKNNVPKDDIDELIAVVDLPKTKESDQYSKPVTQWIKKMIGKAADGTWQIGIGAAGGVLGDALFNYWGTKS